MAVMTRRGDAPEAASSGATPQSAPQRREARQPSRVWVGELLWRRPVDLPASRWASERRGGSRTGGSPGRDPGGQGVTPETRDPAPRRAPRRELLLPLPVPLPLSVDVSRE